MCAEGPQALHDQAVGDASGNNMEPRGQTENCRLSDWLPDRPNRPIVAENEADMGNCFESTPENSTLGYSRSEGNSSTKLDLMGEPTSPLKKSTVLFAMIFKWSPFYLILNPK